MDKCKCEERLREWLQTTPAIIHSSEDDAGACVDNLLHDMDRYDDDDWAYNHLQFGLMTTAHELFAMLTECGEQGLDRYLAARTPLMRWLTVVQTLLTKGAYERVTASQRHHRPRSLPVNMPSTPQQARHGDASWAGPRT